jgi:hypothetical protein
VRELRGYLSPEGFQGPRGAAVIRAGDELYDEAEAVLLAITQGLFPFTSIFVVSVERIEPIVAPRYLLYPETTEAEQIQSAMNTYGVRPADS